MDAFFWQSVLVGFLAQFVDGALGMAYGLVSTSFLLALGVPPAHASAAVHTAEIFTTGASGAAHAWRRNVNWKLVARLAPAGVLGGVAGAVTVSYLPIDIIKP
ncbi:MAG TPA: sulfite exporter TauE/SafE family protein, partial [Terricaulis sp.]|nr:sulfite exporter TauE/SafE family protein [Terricaulis sp.]